MEPVEERRLRSSLVDEEYKDTELPVVHMLMPPSTEARRFLPTGPFLHALRCLLCLPLDAEDESDMADSYN